MVLRSVLAVAFLLANPQDQSGSRVPTPALFEELIDQTNALRTFEAKYRVRVAGQDDTGTLHIVYASPDRAKIEIDHGGKWTMRLQDGVADMRAVSATDEPSFGQFQVAGSTRERYDHLAATIHDILPELADSWREGESFGIRFECQVRPELPGTSHVHFIASVEYPRTAVLGWLSDLSKRPDGHLESDDRVVFEEPNWKLTLSARTGFIERVEKKEKQGVSSFELVSLLLDPELGSEAFDLDPPAEGAEDRSANEGDRIDQFWTYTTRDRLLETIGERVVGGSMKLEKTTRASVQTVLEVLHGDAIAKHNQAWMQNSHGDIDSFATWLSVCGAGSEENDPSQLDHLEAAAIDWRKRLRESMEQGEAAWQSGTAIDASVEAKSEVRVALADIDQAAVSAAYIKVVRDPMLAYFDERVELAFKGN